MTTNIINPVLLKSKGVPCEVHRLVLNDDGTPKQPYERLMDGDEYLYKQVWIKFSNLVMVDIEADEPTGFGSVDNWTDQLDNRATVTLCKTFAILLGLWESSNDGVLRPDIKQAAVVLKDDCMDVYATNVGAAFSISQGVPAEVAGKLLRDAAVALKKEQQAAIDEALKDSPEDEPVAEASIPTAPSPELPGQLSLVDGSEPEVQSTSSGT